MPEPCTTCALPTEQAADVAHPALRVPYANRPFCGRPCVLMRVGDDINDLALAQSGLDAEASRHATLLAAIETFSANLEVARRETADMRENVDWQAATYRRWIHERREQLQQKEDHLRRMQEQLDAMRVEERSTAQRMEHFAQRMARLQQRIAGASRRSMDDDETTRSTRMRFAEPSAAREASRPLFATAAYDFDRAAAAAAAMET